MNNDFIKTTDISLAYVIREELKRQGIKPKFDGVLDFGKFSLEELQSVKRLKLEYDSFKDISILEHCSNLKELKIVSLNSKAASTNLSSEAYYSFISKRSQIKDFSVISKLKSLEFLTISDDDYLTELDLSGLTNLAGLTLTGNHHLTTIRGLDSLEELCSLEIVNNNALTTPIDLKKLMDAQLSDVKLDFDLYPIIKKEYPDIFEYLQQQVKTGGFKIQWAENLSDLRTNDINTNRINSMDEKAKEILKSVVAPDYSDIEKITAIYAFIIENVKYDWDSLNAAKKGEDNEALRKARESMSELTSTILDRRNSSFNAILEGKSVCEGYTNMMHYLLKAVGINSMTVHCSNDMDKSIVGRDSNHSVIKVELNGEWYYFDPTWDAQKTSLKNFFKTKEEFSSNHLLSMTEKEVSNPKIKAYTNEQLTEILQRVMTDKIIRRNEIMNGVRSFNTTKERPTPQDFLDEYTQKLEYLQTEYGSVASKIEELMKRNQQTPIQNYNEQLELLQKQRDEISRQMQPVVSGQKHYQQAIAEQKETEHKAILFHVERLLSMHITPTDGFVYDNDLKVPRAIAKDTNQLSKEQGIIMQRLDDLWMNGEIDLKTKQTMVMEVIKEYEKMKKVAPKPPVRDESTFTQKEELDPTPVKKPYIHQEVKEQVEEQFREKYGYSDMSETERRAFDAKRKKELEDKKRLEEERRELRRQQFAQRKKEMGIDQDKIIDFDELERQQEIIDRMNQEQEMHEDFGMHM